MKEHTYALSVTLRSDLEVTTNQTTNTNDVIFAEHCYAIVLMRGATPEKDRGRIEEAIKHMDWGTGPDFIRVRIQYSQGNGGY